MKFLHISNICKMTSNVSFMKDPLKCLLICGITTAGIIAAHTKNPLVKAAGIFTSLNGVTLLHITGDANREYKYLYDKDRWPPS
jgi:hypothetical protein